MNRMASSAAEQFGELHAKPLDKFVIELPAVLKYCDDVSYSCRCQA